MRFQHRKTDFCRYNCTAFRKNTLFPRNSKKLHSFCDFAKNDQVEKTALKCTVRVRIIESFRLDMFFALAGSGPSRGNSFFSLECKWQNKSQILIGFLPFTCSTVVSSKWFITIAVVTELHSKSEIFISEFIKFVVAVAVLKKNFRDFNIFVIWDHLRNRLN